MSVCGGPGIGFVARRSNAMVGRAFESRKAQPITPGCIQISVCWRNDLLTPRRDPSKPPVTLPAIPLSDQRSVLGGGGRRTNAVRAAITCATAPLPIKNLGGALGRRVLDILDAKSRYLLESVVTCPSLIGGHGMRMRRDVGMDILGVTQTPT